MKHFIPLLLLTLLLSGCKTADNGNTFRQISMEEAVSVMKEENDYIILDVRTPEEFREKHIPDAINIPNETIGTEEIPKLPDNRSKQAAGKLAELGYTNIVEFGGINDWTGEVVKGEMADEPQ